MFRESGDPATAFEGFSSVAYLGLMWIYMDGLVDKILKSAGNSFLYPGTTIQV